MAGARSRAKDSRRSGDPSLRALPRLPVPLAQLRQAQLEARSQLAARRSLALGRRQMVQGFKKGRSARTLLGSIGQGPLPRPSGKHRERSDDSALADPPQPGGNPRPRRHGNPKGPAHLGSSASPSTQGNSLRGIRRGDQPWRPRQRDHPRARAGHDSICAPMAPSQNIRRGAGLSSFPARSRHQHRWPFPSARVLVGPQGLERRASRPSRQAS